MSATELVERDTPPPDTAEPAEGEPSREDLVRLEERRRDAYRVG